METNIASQAYNIKMQIKSLEKQYDGLMNCLKEQYKLGTTHWGAYTLSISVRPGAVEYSKIPQLQGVDLEQYRKDSVQVFKLEYLGE